MNINYLTSALLHRNEISTFVIDNFTDEELKELQVVMKKHDSKKYSDLLKALQVKGSIDNKGFFALQIKKVKKIESINFFFVFLFLNYCFFPDKDSIERQQEDATAKELFEQYPFTENVRKLDRSFVLRACSIMEEEITDEEYKNIIDKSIKETNAKILEKENHKKIENYSKIEDQLRKMEVEFDAKMKEIETEKLGLEELVKRTTDEKKLLEQKMAALETTFAINLAELLKIEDLSPDFPFPNQLNIETLGDLYYQLFQKMVELPIGENDILLSDYLIRSYITLKLYQKEVKV